ncbi:hypothetical protein Tco_1064087 [Tanacetum coccineum]
MGDENHILTLEDYSRPIDEGYRNTTELPEGNNVVPLRLDAICWNDPRDFAKPVKAIYLPQDVSSTSDRCLIELKNQVQRFMEAYLAPKQPIQVNKITSSCEICSGPHDTQYCMENPEQAFVEYASSCTDEVGDDMVSKINLFCKVVYEKLDDTPTRNTTGNLTAQMNFTSTNYPTKEELQGKGIKIPSKLLSLKYLSRSSLAEQNRNPSSLKHVYFVNSIIFLNKEDEAKEEGSMKSSVTEYKDHDMRVESKEEFEEETEEEIKEEEEEDNPKHFDTFPAMKELGYHEWLLKNLQPLWVKAKIRTRNLNNVKFSCMIGHFNKKQAYLDVQSLINVMSRLHYNWIMSNRLKLRRKLSNSEKICNFVGRVMG